MKKVHLVPALVFLFLFSAYGQEGKKAPDFKLEDLNGKTVELKSVYKKGITILSFWATWCKPCMEEMTELNDLYLAFKEKGLNLLAIATDNEKTVARVKPHIKSHGFTFSVLYDTNSEAARKYFAQSIPHTVVIDMQGKIVYTHSGFVKGDEKKLKEVIEKLLK